MPFKTKDASSYRPPVGQNHKEQSAKDAAKTGEK